MPDASSTDWGIAAKVAVPDAIGIQSKLAQMNIYNLDAAAKAREFNALKQYGQGAAAGDPEAMQGLTAGAPNLAATVQNMHKTKVETDQAKADLQRQALTQSALEISQAPADQQAGLLAQRLKLHVAQGHIPQATADYISGMAANNPNYISSLIYGGSNPNQIPEISGRRELAGTAAHAVNKETDESYEDKTLPIEDKNAPGGFRYQTMPKNRARDFMGGATGPTPGMGAPLPAIPWGGGLPPSSGGLPGVTRQPLSDTGEGMPAPGGDRGMRIGGAVPQRISAEAQKYPNLDTELPLAAASIESNFGKAADRPGSQFHGVFQMGQGWRDKMGGSGISHGVAGLSQSKQTLTNVLGREPENWEAYMGWQQGEAGAASLIQNPNVPAGKLVGPAAVRANGGDPNAPASAFLNLWKNKYQQHADRVASFNGATAAGTAEAQPSTRGAAPAAPGASNGAAKQFDLNVGDSIAVQQINHKGAGVTAPYKGEGLGPAGSTARVGDSPETVLARIKTQDKVPATVFLSSGASNNPDQAGFVGDQIDELKAKGAQDIVVPGVGPGVKNAAAVNASLRSVVEQHGGTFFQPQVRWQQDGVHPAEVDKVREQGLQALASKSSSAPAAEPSAADLANAEPTTAKPQDEVIQGSAEAAPNVQKVATTEQTGPADTLNQGSGANTQLAQARPGQLPGIPAPNPITQEEAKRQTLNPYDIEKAHQEKINEAKAVSSQKLFDDSHTEYKEALNGQGQLHIIDNALSKVTTGLTAQGRQVMFRGIAEAATMLQVDSSPEGIKKSPRQVRN